MSTVAIDTAIDKAVADDQVQGASTDASGIADLGATEAEQKTEADYRAAEVRVVDLAAATLDPKDMLKKYAKLGKAGLELAMQRKNGFKAWAKQDYEKVCNDLNSLIRQRVAVKEVEMDRYVRIYLWVEAIKALVPNVEKLSYYQVRYKFLPTLQFDPVALTGEIRKEWLTWMRTTAERQVSDNPMSIKDLDASLEERKDEIERERIARKDPEKALQAELRAAEKKRIAEREAAQTKVLKSVTNALVEGNATESDIADVVGKAMKDRDMDIAKVITKLVSSSEQEMPRGLVGFDPVGCTIEDCRTLCQALFGAGKYAEMKFIRDNLDRMIKVAENAMITSKPA